MDALSADQKRAFRIFHPYAFAATARVGATGQPFVHYTSAEVAVSILTHEEVWMRKSTVMNDFMEIEYGHNCLEQALQKNAGQRLQKILRRISPDLFEELEELFRGWAPHFKQHTYLACLSEHDSTEDFTGRLSMWRAYGGNTGVAMVLKNAPFLNPSDALKAFTSPVAYYQSEDVERDIEAITDAIEADMEFVTRLGRDEIFGRMFDVFRFAMLCVKHPGFREEREWRVIYSPIYEKSEHIIQALEVIRGAPQIVMKVPLKDHPEEGLIGVELPQILDRIIIGPVDHPRAIRDAFIHLLELKNVPNPAEKVWVSDIPLRQ